MQKKKNFYSWCKLSYEKKLKKQKSVVRFNLSITLKILLEAETLICKSHSSNNHYFTQNSTWICGWIKELKLFLTTLKVTQMWPHTYPLYLHNSTSLTSNNCPNSQLRNFTSSNWEYFKHKGSTKLLFNVEKRDTSLTLNAKDTTNNERNLMQFRLQLCNLLMYIKTRKMWQNNAKK